LVNIKLSYARTATNCVVPVTGLRRRVQEREGLERVAMQIST
jgi:hypothetical protein